MFVNPGTSCRSRFVLSMLGSVQDGAKEEKPEDASVERWLRSC